MESVCEDSPVSELSSCMRDLLTHTRRRLTLTPELSPERQKPSEQLTETPTVNRRRGQSKISPPEQPSLKLRRRRARCLRRDLEDDEDDDEVGKENPRKRVRVRLFSKSSPDPEEETRPKRQYHLSPEEGSVHHNTTLTPDPQSVMLFQKLRSRRKSAQRLIPDPAITDQHLIGDFSKKHVLPVERVDYQELHCVSAQTVSALITGQFSSAVEDFLIIDCRYPYEYQGGHIKGAVNLYTEAQIQQAFLHSFSSFQTSPGAQSDTYSPVRASVVGMQTPVRASVVGMQTPVRASVVGMQTPVRASVVDMQAPVRASVVGMQTPVRASVVGMQTPVRASVVDMQAPVRASVVGMQTPVRASVVGMQTPVRASVVDMQAPVRASVVDMQAPVRASVVGMQTPVRASVVGMQTPVRASMVGMQAPVRASVVGMEGPVRASVMGTQAPERGEVHDGGASPRKLIVFHCEFSSERGPRLCQYLRELDRAVNAQSYPQLLFPELYLLQGGYKHFYTNYPDLCEPCDYVPMLHQDFREQLRSFSRKKKFLHLHRRRPIRVQQRAAHI